LRRPARHQLQIGGGHEKLESLLLEPLDVRGGTSRPADRFALPPRRVNNPGNRGVELRAILFPSKREGARAHEQDVQPRGFRRQPRWPLPAQSLGIEKLAITAGRMSYDLRRLRRHGIIQRLSGTHRCRLTEAGPKTVQFYSRADQRLREPPVPGQELPGVPPPPN
jgi:hypothetical protein